MQKLKEKFIRTYPIPSILRYYNPYVTCCSRCGLPWDYCKIKSVMYSKSRGCFATCDICWGKSTLPEVLAYFSINYYKYWSGDSDDLKLETLFESIIKEYLETHKT